MKSLPLFNRVPIWISVLTISCLVDESSANTFADLPLIANTTTITTSITSETAIRPPAALRDECGHTLRRPSGFIERHFDWRFLKRFFRHWNPFSSRARVKMQFYLYKRDFPECGREINPDNDETLETSDFDARHQTRIIIHGWMSQSKGSLNRSVKNAYLSLTKPANITKTITATATAAATANTTQQQVDVDAAANESDAKDTNKKVDESQEKVESRMKANADENDAVDVETFKPLYDDFNVIVVDWSVISSNVNYFGVVDLVEELGFLLAEFVRYLYIRTGLHFDDVYLIGHSLGAQIAGSAGKQVYPFKFNTIFALDPAGPKFRDFPDEYRIDPTDAQYVESIHTSSSLGFQEPAGHASFYPNYGHDQKNCYIYGCSHSRAHDYFAESITSQKGFWGTLCRRESKDKWIISDSGAEFRMGGEPSTPKHGTFYVKTNAEPPYAMGRRKQSMEIKKRKKRKKPGKYFKLLLA